MMILSFITKRPASIVCLLLLTCVQGVYACEISRHTFSTGESVATGLSIGSKYVMLTVPVVQEYTEYNGNKIRAKDVRLEYTVKCTGRSVITVTQPPTTADPTASDWVEKLDPTNTDFNTELFYGIEAVSRRGDPDYGQEWIWQASSGSVSGGDYGQTGTPHMPGPIYEYPPGKEYRIRIASPVNSHRVRTSNYYADPGVIPSSTHDPAIIIRDLDNGSSFIAGLTLALQVRPNYCTYPSSYENVEVTPRRTIDFGHIMKGASSGFDRKSKFNIKVTLKDYQTTLCHEPPTPEVYFTTAHANDGSYLDTGMGLQIYLTDFYTGEVIRFNERRSFGQLDNEKGQSSELSFYANLRQEPGKEVEAGEFQATITYVVEYK